MNRKSKMPPEDEAITSLFFKDTNPSDPNKDKTEGFGWTKRRETNPRKSHQIKEEKVIESGVGNKLHFSVSAIIVSSNIRIDLYQLCQVLSFK